MSLREFKVREFDKGLVTSVEDFSIPENAASSSLNWLTMRDKIELSGGYSVVGTEQSGTGKVTGLFVGEKVDGTLLPFRSRGKKAEYYDPSTLDWVEIGTDILGTAADGEGVAFTQYVSLAGYQVWFSSPNSGLFKAMMANPGSAEDQYDAAENFKGLIKAQNGRLYLWNRTNNRNYVYGSYKDVQNSVVYTAVSGEAVGALGSTAYSGTLAAVTGKRTCFGVVITDGTLTLTDDKDGGFTGDGTGTIDYTTGAYSVTFSGTTTGPVTASYSWEDSTEKGLADFTFSSTRLATEGFFLPQPTGGDLRDVLFYRTESYCLHDNSVWLLSIDLDDLTVTNQVFRVNAGMSSFRAAVESGDGIYFVDDSNPAKPTFSLLTLDGTNAEVVPTVFSYAVDLSGYDFSEAAAYKWGDYVLFFCKEAGAASNNRLFAYNRLWKSFDLLEYSGTVAADRGGELWAGDSSTDNVLKLFAGHTANGSVPRNHWEGKLSQLGIDELKKTKRLTLRGQIGPAQTISVSISYDGGAFVPVGEVEGDGDYVSSVATTVGSTMVGSAEIGGGSGGATAYDYVREFRVRSGKFDECKVRLEATGVGYASVTEIEHYDVRAYGQKNLRRFRTT